MEEVFMYVEFLFPVIWIALALFFTLAFWKIGSGMHARAAAESANSRAQILIADALRRLAVIAENSYSEARNDREKKRAEEREAKQWLRDQSLLGRMLTKLLSSLEDLGVSDEKWTCILDQDEEAEDSGLQLSFYPKMPGEKLVVHLSVEPGEIPVCVQSCDLLKFAGDHSDLDHLEGELCETLFEDVEDAAGRLAEYMLRTEESKEPPLHDLSSSFDETQTA